jgi:opacity protein-like surface antigen
MKSILKGAALAVVLALPSHAQNAGEGNVGFGLGVSTLGLTGDVSYQLNPNWTVRMLAGGGRTSQSGTISDDDTNADYRAKLNIGGIGPVVDYHPFSNGWRISGGALLSNYRADVRISGTIEIDDTEYQNADLRGRIRTNNRIMPKLAVGYNGSNVFGTRFGFSIDAGVLYTGGFGTTLKERGPSDINPADLNSLRRDINDEIGGVKFLPYVSLGLRMNF